MLRTLYFLWIVHLHNLVNLFTAWKLNRKMRLEEDRIYIYFFNWRNETRGPRKVLTKKITKNHFKGRKEKPTSGENVDGSLFCKVLLCNRDIFRVHFHSIYLFIYFFLLVSERAIPQKHYLGSFGKVWKVLLKISNREVCSSVYIRKAAILTFRDKERNYRQLRISDTITKDDYFFGTSVCFFQPCVHCVSPKTGFRHIVASSVQGKRS